MQTEIRKGEFIVKQFLNTVTNETGWEMIDAWGTRIAWSTTESYYGRNGKQERPIIRSIGEYVTRMELLEYRDYLAAQTALLDEVINDADFEMNDEL